MNTYIVLAAGKGASLAPLTLKFPKTSYKLDEDTTVLQRMVRSIRAHDREAEIVVVVGYLADSIREELVDDNVKFAANPFYEVTNSITSLWFARDYLERENVAIVHGDVVFDEFIVSEHLVKPTSMPYVLLDSSRAQPGCYNAVVEGGVVEGGKVLVMSKNLAAFDAQYCCMAKLDPVSARLLKQEVDDMVHSNMYDQFFEDALVQMVMFKNFELGCADIAGHSWSEVNTVDDLLVARSIVGAGD